MTSRLDELGIWIDLGTILPNGNWQFFPREATQGLSIFKIVWGGDLSNIKSRIQFRAIYNQYGFSVPSSRWFRLFPKQGSEICFFDFPDELKTQTVVRGFQAVKWYKYLKNGINIDSPYSLNLQEFQPLPEFEKEIRPLSPSLVQEIVSEVLKRSGTVGTNESTFNPPLFPP
jgi:hypothetical protein